MSFERPNIENMEGYSPGEQPQEASTIKLNTNENPYPASPEVEAALQKVEVGALRRYPSPMAADFRKAAAELHGVSEDNIIPTNGSDELLRLALTTFVDSGDTIVTTQPSYSLYPVLANIHGCKLLEIPLEDDWSMAEDFLQQAMAAQARMIIIVNPHAPTGKLYSSKYIEQLAEEFNGVLLVDEAYVDFIDPELNHDSIPLIRECENILLLRTLSKGYSLAGLRFGYGIAAKSLADPILYKTRDSYNTDDISQQLATAALNSVAYARQTWEKTRAERRKLTAALQGFGIICSPSQSNFLLCQIPDRIGAENLYQLLKQRNILVRYFDQERLRDKLRISIGSKDENLTLLAEIEEIINNL